MSDGAHRPGTGLREGIVPYPVDPSSSLVHGGPPYIGMAPKLGESLWEAAVCDQTQGSVRAPAWFWGSILAISVN